VQLCDEPQLEELMRKLASDDVDGVSSIDELLSRFPDDARLHFLRGSVLAHTNDKLEALSSMEHAVTLEPDFHIARFQVGFFALSSGDAASALTHWGPLMMLPEEHYLYQFATGLTHLIRDEFAQAIEHLKTGITANKENLPLSGDMQLIIEKCTELPEETESSEADQHEDNVVSSTSMLLGQFGTPGKKH